MQQKVPILIMCLLGGWGVLIFDCIKVVSELNVPLSWQEYFFLYGSQLALGTIQCLFCFLLCLGLPLKEDNFLWSGFLAGVVPFLLVELIALLNISLLFSLLVFLLGMALTVAVMLFPPSSKIRMSAVLLLSFFMAAQRSEQRLKEIQAPEESQGVEIIWVTFEHASTEVQAFLKEEATVHFSQLYAQSQGKKSQLYSLFLAQPPWEHGCIQESCTDPKVLTPAAKLFSDADYQTAGVTSKAVVLSSEGFELFGTVSSLLGWGKAFYGRHAHQPHLATAEQQVDYALRWWDAHPAPHFLWLDIHNLDDVELLRRINVEAKSRGHHRLFAVVELSQEEKATSCFLFSSLLGRKKKSEALLEQSDVLPILLELSSLEPALTMSDRSFLSSAYGASARPFARRVSLGEEKLKVRTFTPTGFVELQGTNNEQSWSQGGQVKKEKEELMRESTQQLFSASMRWVP